MVDHIILKFEVGVKSLMNRAIFKIFVIVVGVFLLADYFPFQPIGAIYADY